MKKFEYKVISLNNYSSESILNLLGIEGWELVSVNSIEMAYLKRELITENHN